MSEVIYVIVRRGEGTIARGSGPRKILAYTSEGRAWAAMKPLRLSEDEYEVVEFTRKGSD